MHKIDFYNRICIMKRLPVRKRLSKPLASVATCASRQGNYHFRLANVFASRFLPSRIFIIKQFFCKINFMFNYEKTRISGYLQKIFYQYNSHSKLVSWPTKPTTVYLFSSSKSLPFRINSSPSIVSFE